MSVRDYLKFKEIEKKLINSINYLLGMKSTAFDSNNINRNILKKIKRGAQFKTIVNDLVLIIRGRPHAALTLGCDYTRLATLQTFQTFQTFQT